jgi:hypothetical protein
MNEKKGYMALKAKEAYLNTYYVCKHGGQVFSCGRSRVRVIGCSLAVGCVWLWSVNTCVVYLLVITKWHGRRNAGPRIGYIIYMFVLLYIPM